MAKFIINTVWAEIAEDGSWRVDATRSEPETTLEDVLDTVHNLEKRDNVLAVAWHYNSNIFNKKGTNK